MDGRISAAAPLALADQLPLPMICKVRFRPGKMRYIRIIGFSFLPFWLCASRTRVTACVGERSRRPWYDFIFMHGRQAASSLVARHWRSCVGRWLPQWSHSTAEQSATTTTRPRRHKLPSRAVAADTIVLQRTHIATLRSTRQQQWVAVVRRHLNVASITNQQSHQCFTTTSHVSPQHNTQRDRSSTRQQQWLAVVRRHLTVASITNQQSHQCFTTTGHVSPQHNTQRDRSRLNTISVIKTLTSFIELYSAMPAHAWMSPPELQQPQFSGDFF